MKTEQIPKGSWIVLVLGLLLGAGLLLPDPEIAAEDVPRESSVCMDCHEGYEANLTGTPHQMDPDSWDGADAAVACTDCHVGDARHYEEDPEAYAMTNPADLGAFEEGQLCSSCHMTSHQQNMMEKNVHAMNDVNCDGCHQVHGGGALGLLRDDQATLCGSCHTSVEAQFARSFRHPVNDGIVQCSECHLTLDRTSTELSQNGTNAACVDCHTEFKGPFPYEHQATVDYSTEEGGCLSCHAAHGSDLPRMLKQPYEAPHSQLCSQCHSVPLHNRNSQHGTRFAGVSCNSCHTDIHGSYTNRNFISESLRGQGCFNSGCHQY